MKKKLSAAAVSLFSVMVYSQVGINSSSPKATLDITAKTTDGSKPEGIISPRLTGDQIQLADAQYGSDQKGTIIYATTAVTSPSVKTAGITEEGYYFFDGSIWQKIGVGSDTSIYKGSGNLSGNTVVSQSANTLAFTGTSANAFSVDGNTFSIDAAGHRLGLGTASPQSRLHIVGDGGLSDDLVINSGSNSQTSSGLYAFYRSRGSHSTPSAVADGDWLGTGSYQGYDGNNYQGGARIGAVVNGTVGSGSVPTDLLFATGSSSIDEKMRITSGGNVGIATSAPTQKLDVDGTARLRNIPSSGGTVMLTADNDGVIRKQALPTSSAPVIFPATTTSGVSLTPSNWNTPNYTGTSIIIPANSKYIITSNQLLGTNNANNIMPAGQSVWLQTTFSDSSTSFQYSSDIQGSSLISGIWGSSNQYGTVSGAIILNNTSSAAKTYYYWTVRVVNNGYSGEISNFGGSGWGENQIYAIPVN